MSSIAVVVAALAMAIGAASPPVLWPLAKPIPHVFDVTGPRSDGRLVIAAGGKLFLMDRTTGALDRFAGGPGGYPGAGGEEPYMAIVPAAVAVHSAFHHDDLFVLQLKPAGVVIRIDPAGIAHPFADVAAVDFLNGMLSTRRERSATACWSQARMFITPRSRRSMAPAR